MIRALIPILSIALTIYTLIDCAKTPEPRNLPKWGWILLIIFTGFIGSIAYLIAGRQNRGFNPGGRKRIIPPDDNPDFLRKL